MGRATGVRAEQAAATRARILDAAERLFAEEGLAAVSHRRIGAEAGQRNVTAVGYHFGDRTDLVRALLLRHQDEMEEARRALVAVARPGVTADWLRCLVQPVLDVVVALPQPTWMLRCGAQLLSDPGVRALLEDEVLAAPWLVAADRGLDDCLGHLGPDERADRRAMVRTLVVQLYAEREAAVAALPADGVAAAWGRFSAHLVAATTGLLEAPAAD